jgi:hypothetical protein
VVEERFSTAAMAARVEDWLDDVISTQRTNMGFRSC